MSAEKHNDEEGDQNTIDVQIETTNLIISSAIGEQQDPLRTELTSQEDEPIEESPSPAPIPSEPVSQPPCL